MTSSIDDCRWVKLLDKRLEKMRGEYIWDEEKACQAVSFIEKNLRHWKAPFSGKPFILSDWQRERIVKPLWGLRNKDGTRVFRKAYIQIPRKNGKSALAAALLLLIFATDGEGLECYTAATKRDQAKIVFKDCTSFVKASPRLKKRLKVMAQHINYDRRNSVLMPLSSDYNNLDGLNVSGAVIDELHAHKSPDLHDVIQTATGSREQPLVLCITTAGKNRNGVCFEQYEYACKVLEGGVRDDTYFAYIAEADKGLKWDDPAAYRQANPNLGISVREDYLEGERKRALEIPSYRRTYERYHLDRWVRDGVDRWLPLESWISNEKSWRMEEVFAGKKVYAGIDLASTTDLAAMAFAAPWGDKVRLGVRFFCPESTIYERAREDGVPYDVWRDEGWLIATPGDVIDYRRVVAEMKKHNSNMKIVDCSFDQWNSTYVYTELEDAGIEMVEFVQGLRSFHPPCKELEKRVIEGSLEVEENPVMRWMAGHVKVRRDESDKMRPVKDYKSSKERIDGIIAALMALDGLMRGEGGGADELPPENLRELMGI